MAGGGLSCDVALFNREIARLSTQGSKPAGQMGIPRSKGVMNLHSIYEEEECELDELTEEAIQDLQGDEHQASEGFPPYDHDLEEADNDGPMEFATQSTSGHGSLHESSYSLRTSLCQSSSEESWGSDARPSNTIHSTRSSPAISLVSSNEAAYRFSVPPTLLPQIPASSHQGSGGKETIADCSILVKTLDLSSKRRSNCLGCLACTRVSTDMPAAHIIGHELGPRVRRANTDNRTLDRSVTLPSFPAAWQSIHTAYAHEVPKHSTVDIDIERTAGSGKADEPAQVGRLDSIMNLFLLSMKLFEGPGSARRSVTSNNTTELGTVIHHSWTVGDDTVSLSMASSGFLSARPYRSTLYRVSTLPDAESVVVSASSYDGDGDEREGQWIARARRYGANVGVKICGVWYRMVEISRVAIKTVKKGTSWA